MSAPSHPSRRNPARPPSTGRRAWSLVAGTLRLVGRVLRGLIAATVLLALVAGLPWALWHFIGWPLPHHVPTWAEVHGVLLGPMTTTFLLDFLACLCWITWAAFTIDVLRCTVDLARGGFGRAAAARLPDFSAAGPMHAGVLVGAVLLSVLGHRPAPAPAASPATALGTGSPVVATAPAWQHPAPGNDIMVRTAVFATQTTTGGSTTAVSAPAHPESIAVLAPQNGVYDSLSRIAARTLGDAARWPEIFDLNKGKTQRYGHTFTNPNLIYPGEELALPADATRPTTPPGNPPSQPTSPAPTTTAPPTTTVPPATSPPPTSLPPATATPQAPSTQQAPPAATGTHPQPSATREPGFSWGPDLFVGLFLAAAISAALLIARRRHNSRYRPGSGDRDELPVAPVVYQLRLAHLRAEHDDTEFDLDDDTGDNEGEHPRRDPSQPPVILGASQTGPGRPPALAPGLGVRDGREVAVDLATARGLGLLGAGAPAAARALLIAALTTTTRHRATASQLAGATVVVPADDLAALLGRGTARAHLPDALNVVADLDNALDVMEAEILVRAAASQQQSAEPRSWPPLVLVARPPQQHQRLQAILDNGAPFGVLGLLLGQWQPGVTCYVREDGTISATGPGMGEALRGTRMFRLGDDDTAELLTLLHQADPDTPAEDQMDTPSAPRPRIVPPHPAGNPAPGPNQTTTLETGHADDDVELEVAAAVQEPAPADTELEILGPTRASTPGARLRPPTAARQQPAAPRVASHNETHDEIHHEVSAEHGPTGETATNPAEPSPTTSVGGEPGAAPAPITITILGGLRVHWNPEPGTSTPDTASGHHEREITGALQPKTKELLVLLALHPEGTTRETLVSALWGQDPPARPTNALHTALSRMRHTLATATDGAVTEIASAADGRYRLDPGKVRVDYWRFAEAVTARRAAATDHARVDAYRQVVNSYSGALAEGMSNEWIEPAREAIRRDAIDAVAALARALVEDDPQQTLDLLEIARAFDPHNEALYRDIMRLQERLGQPDAIPRTLTLLATRLAEINERPSEHATALATRLRQRHQAGMDTPARQSEQDTTPQHRHAAS